MSFPSHRPSTWFVTGTSRGLGLELVTQLLQRVEPGYFRTKFLAKDSLALPADTTDAYPAIREMTESHLNLQGNQLGDPDKGARAIIDQVVASGGALRQLLGSDAHAYATAKVDALRVNLDATALTAPTTDHPAT